jgi:hypothetical protein
MEVGVSQPVGFRWFREAGGIPPSHLSRSSKLLSGRYLVFAEREEIAIWCAQGCGVREIARRLGRAPSTISRELRRNAATRGGNLDYRATTAQWHAERAARRPKLSRRASSGDSTTNRRSPPSRAPSFKQAQHPPTSWLRDGQSEESRTIEFNSRDRAN